MRHRLFGWAVACVLSWLLSPGQAAAQARIMIERLQSELEVLNVRIEEADGLLRQIDAGGGYLMGNRMILVVVPRDEVIRWATEHLYNEGTDSGYSVGQAEVLRRVQLWVGRSPGLIAALRQTRQEDVSRRGVVERELASLRAAQAQAWAAADCGFPRRWRVNLEGRGAYVLGVNLTGNVVTEGGGQATLIGNQLTIRVARQDVGLSGRYLVSRDAACNGFGELIFDSLPAEYSTIGIRPGRVTFTNLGR